MITKCFHTLFRRRTAHVAFGRGTRNDDRSYQDLEMTPGQEIPDPNYTEIQLQPVYETVFPSENLRPQ